MAQLSSNGPARPRTTHKESPSRPCKAQCQDLGVLQPRSPRHSPQTGPVSELRPSQLPPPSWPLVPANRRASLASGTRAQDLGDILSLRKLCSRQELLKVINSISGSPRWERRKHVSNTPGRGIPRRGPPPLLPHQRPTRLLGILQPLEREVTPHPEGVWETRSRSCVPIPWARSGWPGCGGTWGAAERDLRREASLPPSPSLLRGSPLGCSPWKQQG